MVDPDFAEKMQKMREHHRANFITAYLVYINDVGSISVIMENEVPKTAFQDNFENFTKSKAIDLVMIIDRDSTEILWTIKNYHMKVGDTFEMIHEVWASLAKLPRYYDVGNGKVVDNYAGGRIIDRPT